RQLLDRLAAGGAADQGDAGGGGAGAVLEGGDAVGEGAQQSLDVGAGHVLAGGGGAHAGEGGAGGVAEKFAAETCFAASGSSGTAIEFAQALDETVGRGNYSLQLIPPPAGPGGNIMGPRNFWHGFMLSSTVAESENFLAILQFLDWLYFAPEAREMLRWGVEGETYTKAEDGTIELTEATPSTPSISTLMPRRTSSRIWASRPSSPRPPSPGR